MQNQFSLRIFSQKKKKEKKVFPKDPAKSKEIQLPNFHEDRFRYIRTKLGQVYQLQYNIKKKNRNLLQDSNG